VNLKGLIDSGTSAPTQLLRGGDSVYVPRAEQFFILGEVQKPSMYKLEANLTVIQAISLAGGVTPRGSDRRVEIKRSGKNGEQVIIKPKPNDLVLPDDVIRVMESIFCERPGICRYWQWIRRRRAYRWCRRNTRRALCRWHNCWRSYGRAGARCY
jgi:protein involved in polysaccharide export with SLBB domain